MEQKQLLLVKTHGNRLSLAGRSHGEVLISTLSAVIFKSNCLFDSFEETVLGKIS